MPLSTSTPTTALEAHTIGIFIFDQVEVLDFAGPYEVFTTAARVHARLQPQPAPLFEVCTIGRTPEPIKARAGLQLTPDYTLDNHPPLTVLIIPGGVINAEIQQTDTIAWIHAQAQRVQLLSSVCTGAFLLAQAGLLDGLEATTHWEDQADLQTQFPALTVKSHVRWVDQGAIITSAGISAGIDMSLHVIEKLHSRTLAERTARQLEFDWTENP